MKPGRNDPCRCGSGLKYKKCHLQNDENEMRTREPHHAPVHDAGMRLVERIGRWAYDRFGPEFAAAGNDLALEEMEGSTQFIVPWAIFHHRLRGMPVLEWYARENADNLSRRDREMIDAQRQSWIGFWEVRETVPGKSMILTDLLSGEKRLVQEASGSRSLVARDVFLGRVVDFGDVSVIDGMYPRALPPEEASSAVEFVRQTLNVKLPIAVEELRDFSLSLLIVKVWKRAVESYDERLRTPPRLQNTDGDPIRLTVDRYQFAPGDRAAIEKSIGALKGACSIAEDDDGTRSITFIKSGNKLHEDWENTTIGVAITSENDLRIETNSTRRANGLKKVIEKACRGLISDHARTQTDATEMFESARNRETPHPPREPMNEEIQAVIRDQKIGHYENWIKMPIPALGGKTPKQAARSARGRGALDALLKGIENREAREPAGTRYDVNILRRALRIEE
ncbi:MAG: SEC-C domain-containing protein [Acidobacteria bacterium]|nr:SEC-C domain-containing protein [Acidobacteriota bacterium]MBV9067068.1 SEC-C domain-containing protein [Acidobacteriota bacterium]MBV9187116.1 SEC-C domain-containing protein [Acidobacteriota bacterium]